MAKNFKIKLDSDKSEDIVDIDLKNREKIAKEVAQHQEEFEAAPEDPKDKVSLDNIFAFDSDDKFDAGDFEPSEASCCKGNESSDCEYEERRRNAVAGLADAVADLSAALITITSLVETVLVQED